MNNDLTQKLVGAMNAKAVQDAQELSQSMGVMGETLGELVRKLAREQLAHERALQRVKQYEQALNQAKQQLDGYAVAAQANKDTREAESHPTRAQYADWFKFDGAEYRCGIAARDYTLRLLELRDQLEAYMDVRGEWIIPVVQERDELLDVLNSIGAKCETGDDGKCEWRFPFYDGDGNACAVLPLGEWREKRIECARQLERLQNIEDINEYVVRGDVEKGLLVGIRAALAHLEAGRDTWALDGLRKLAKSAQVKE